MLQSIGKGLLPLALVVSLSSFALRAMEDMVVPANTAATADTADSATMVVKKDKKDKKRKKSKKAEEAPAESDVVFADNAFPPVIPDTDWHQETWQKNDCLRCHETGVREAPVVVHAGMADILLKAQCRSCHVLIPGAEPRKIEPQPSIFAPNAFPPMIPASGLHMEAWIRDDCLLCHDGGIADAPEVKHEGLPPILLTAKCRSCHVQVRADEASAE